MVRWDPAKAAANLRKHGIDFADAETALSDERAITILDNRHQEERFVSVATDAFGRILVLVYVWRGDDIRLISARKATRAERRHYEGAR